MEDEVRRKAYPWLVRCVIVAVLCMTGHDAAGQTVIVGDDAVEWIDADHADMGSDGSSPEPIGPDKAAGGAKVLGADDRENVGDTTDWPWRTIGRITAEFPDSENTVLMLRGTGVLIGPRTVLTCAHVLVRSQQWANVVTFTPGLNGEKEPYGTYQIVKRQVPQTYWKTEDSDHDLGLMVLSKSIGYTTGYMTLESMAVASLKKIGLNVAGYPSDIGQSAELYHAFGHTDGVVGNQIRHYADTANGQSGSPAWVYYESNQTRRIVGVHIGSAGDHNSAIHINETYFDFINDYLKENDTVYYEAATGLTGGPTTGSAPSGSESHDVPSIVGCVPAGVLVIAALTLLACGVGRSRRRRP